MHSMQKQEPDQTTPLLSSINNANIQKKHSPCKAVTFILASKFCQYFTFFGIETVLILYLVQVLLYKEDTATVIFHGCSLIASFSPLIGAYLADVLFGRFKTIAYLFVLYIIGNCLICMASVPEFLPMRPISLLGIFVIHITHRSILPCSSALGGDQFKPTQSKEMGMFFSMTFVCMKLSQIAAMFLTPELRADVHCFGQSTCFPLTFGVTTIFIILSLIIFLIGYPYYKINPASGNIIFDVVKCITHAVIEKFKMKKKMRLEKKHWLDYADDKYDIQMISDIKSLLNISMMFLPIPIFWSLCLQQGSKWTLQATRLNNLVAGYQIKPDQMQVTNSVLSIIIIYILDYVMYPLLSKCKLLTRPLQRMTVGGLFVSFAFVAAGFLQLSIEKNLTSRRIENNTNFDNNDINGTLLPLVAGLQLSDMKSKQNLQLFAVNCSLNEVSNTDLEARRNKTIKCLYNNGTLLYILHNKFINSTGYETNDSFSLHSNSFPISGEENGEKFPISSRKNETLKLSQHALVGSTSLSILLQIPQYFLLTSGEMMFVITSIQFAYSQAPKTMKTITPALLFICNAIGNVIVMVITGINLFQRQSQEFFFYAILLAIDMFIFAMLARCYKYNKQDR